MARYISASAIAALASVKMSAATYSENFTASVQKKPGLKKARARKKAKLRLSLSGAHMAGYIQDTIVALDEEFKPITSSSVEGFKVRSIRWIDEDHLLMTYGTTQDLGFGFG